MAPKQFTADQPANIDSPEISTSAEKPPRSWWAFCFNVVKWIVLGVLGLVAGLFLLANFAVPTPRVGAYRDLHPRLEQCKQGLRDGWTILAKRDPSRENKDDDDRWVDPSNHETFAAQEDAAWTMKLRCALQKHVVPSQQNHARDLVYHLGFIEFDEAGEPYALVQPSPDGKDELPVAALTNPQGQPQMLTQLDALRQHLQNGSNYVIVFIHGWRHNANVGDDNVADLRHYAAHVARFLNRRCELGEKTFCTMHVTAIYIGWRGARVDEVYAQHLFGETLGGYLGTISALPTLFDRKPVSEQVAPGAISAIRAIERTMTRFQPNGLLKENPQENRMIVFGHSLGGNMLATGLKDDLIKLVREHKGYDPATKTPALPIPPVLGDLTVLINPAAEASKWTAIQREVWGRIPFHVDAAMTLADVEMGHKFFPDDQRPVIVSVTSALRFPPGGFRKADCEWLHMDAGRLQKIEEKIGHGNKTPDYDWATQLLFPTFKFDFRPLALRIQGRTASGKICDGTGPSLWSRMLRGVASFLANFPFQNYDSETSHTIGHFDPPRPADGLLTDMSFSSGAPFGTTHELFGISKKKETHNPYATLADAPLPCEPANRWLSRARAAAPPFGTFWDTERIPSSTVADESPPAARFIHGSHFSGTAAITRANDPFWNMRAYDNALARHDGYRLSSFICAMNQLVMDDITPSRLAIPNLAIDPTSRTTAAPAKP